MSGNETAVDPAPATSQTRRRARVACRGCNQRKVRCNVAAVGRPCANCSQDHIDCEVLPRKRRATNRVRQAHAAQGEGTASLPCDDTIHVMRPSPPGREADAARDEEQRPSIGGMGATAPHPRDLLGSMNGDTLSARSLEGETETTNRAGILYSGDTHGDADSLGALLTPAESHPGSSFLVPGYTAKLTPPEELEFLRIKGAFSIPPKDVCDEAVRAFFCNAHPLLPVLNAKHFLDQYSRYGCQGISLLLLWSVFHVAAGFLNLDSVKRSGFQTRKAMKVAMYQRAKLLYDNTYENNPLAVVQAVILLSYWHPDNQDRFEAWYWTGIAISMCQSFGFHRISRTSTSQYSSASSQRLICRIWWCCVVRDRWLSLIKGRPMRIGLNDCDVPLPSPSDIAEELNSLSPQHLKDTFIPYAPKRIGETWCTLVRLSVLLGKILKLHASDGWQAEIGKIEQLESELHNHLPALEWAQTLSRYEKFFSCQVRLHYEATAIVLYRPVIFSKDPLSSVPSSYQHHVRDKTRAAAGNINATIEQIMDLDLVQSISPTIITTLIPPMQIHLLDCTSSATLTRSLGSHRLGLCMILLSELRSTYWGAEMAFQMFQRAQAKLTKASDEPCGLNTDSSSSIGVTASQSNTILTSTTSEFNPSELYSSAEDVLTSDIALSNTPALPMRNFTQSDDDTDILNNFLSLEEFNGFGFDNNHVTYTA